MQEEFNRGFLSYLENRRSVTVNFLKSPGPNGDELAAMLKIASRIPDHGKLAPWRFVVYGADQGVAIGDFLAARAKELNPEIDEATQAFERNRFAQAPLAIGVISALVAHPKVPDWEQQLAAGVVCYNLLQAANAHGYGAQWLTGWHARDDKTAPFLGANAGETFVGFIFIGTAEKSLPDRDRPDVGARTTIWQG